MEISWSRIIAILAVVAFIVVVILVGRSMSRKKPAEGEPPAPGKKGAGDSAEPPR